MSRHNSGPQDLRCGIFPRDHGYIVHVAGDQVKFAGTTAEYEEKRRLEERIKNMTAEEKQKLLAQLLEG